MKGFAEMSLCKAYSLPGIADAHKRRKKYIDRASEAAEKDVYQEGQAVVSRLGQRLETDVVTWVTVSVMTPNIR